MGRALCALGLLIAVGGCSGATAQAPPADAPGPAARCQPRAPSGSPFELIVLGSGGPRGFGRAASGYVVAIGGVPRVLIDVGPGAYVRLGEMDLDFEALDTVLLTHLHVDHAGDLPGFVKSRNLTYQRPLSFRIFGPAAGPPYPSTTAFIDRLFGDSGAFAYLPSFRNELRFDVTDLPGGDAEQPQDIVQEDGLRIQAIAVDHGDVPALAYRIEHAGHALVLSGDLASKDERITRLAAGADVLVYDTAVLDPPRSPPQLYDLHTPPQRIGEVAAEAKVSLLLLSHIPPVVERAKDDVLRSVGAAYDGQTMFAEDCLRIDVTQPSSRD